MFNTKIHRYVYDQSSTQLDIQNSMGTSGVKT